jgi:hypothetical protein
VARQLESGSVTAELVVALPAVILVAGLLFGILNLQMTRIELVNTAAVAARAVARDEPPVQLTKLANSKKAEFQISVSGVFVCVRASKNLEFGPIRLGIIELEETQCARIQGI